MLCDIRNGLPFGNNTIDALRARDVCEHINPPVIPFFNECWRVVKPNCMFKIEVPRFPHVDSVKDPTHVSFFTVETFTEYFGGPDRLEAEYNMKMWDVVELGHSDRRIWVSLIPRGK